MIGKRVENEGHQLILSEGFREDHCGNDNYMHDRNESRLYTSWGRV